MQEKPDVFDRFHQAFSNMKGHFHILERQVPVDVQMDYFKQSERVKEHKPLMQESKMGEFESELYNDLIPIDEKKHILLMFANSRDVKGYRILEKYAENPVPELSDWTSLALVESRMSLESELSGEKQIFISTGLGGRNNKLRFYTLLLSADRQPFQDYQRQVIEREFSFAFSKLDIEIEELNVADNHVEMLYMIPVQTNLKEVLNNTIAECNIYGNFLSNDYTVTNLKKLTPDEIQKIIHEKDGDTQASN